MTSISVIDSLLSTISQTIDNNTNNNLTTKPTNRKPLVFFVLGGPGAGKGTQCKKLVQEFGLIHLSAGDLLRAERNLKSKNAELINNYIKEGQIVPVEITVNLIKKAMLKNMNYGYSTFIIDGFPRNYDNFQGWNKIMKDFAEVPFLLLLECTEDEMTNRILLRAKNATVQRKDDNLKTLPKRFAVFKENTMQVVQEFKNLNKCFCVKSMGAIDDIYQQVRKLFIPYIIKPSVVFVLGGPGAGKGTQCSKIEQEFGFVHLSAGNLLRAERNSGSKNAELINNYIKEGKIVPVEITVGLIKKAMKEKMCESKTVFIIDGFPRNINNYNGWNKIMFDFANVEFLLLLECTEDVMIERIAERAQKQLLANPNAKKRVDSSIETIRKRFHVYEQSTIPVLNIFKKQNAMEIVSSMNAIDEVYDDVRRLFLPFVKKPNVIFVLGGPGAGKGTQCAKLVAEFGYCHLSAGDLLRAERNLQSCHAQLINDCISGGKIVPVEITVGLIRKAMMNYMRHNEYNGNGEYIFVIDGFPRNFDNLQGWNRIMSTFADVSFLLWLKCSENEMQKRILKRASKSMKKRLDDNLVTIGKRFGIFNNDTMPVIDVFCKDGKCVEVNAMDSIDNVYGNVRRVFVSRFYSNENSESNANNAI